MFAHSIMRMTDLGRYDHDRCGVDRVIPLSDLECNDGHLLEMTIEQVVDRQRRQLEEAGI